MDLLLPSRPSLSTQNGNCVRVKKTTQGLVHGPVEQGDRATESVDCKGGERELEECPHMDRDEGERECKLEQDIVSVSCQYDSLATCGPKEVRIKKKNQNCIF